MIIINSVFSKSAKDIRVAASQRIDALITTLPGILAENDPEKLVEWTANYALPAETANYGSAEQKKKITDLFAANGIKPGIHTDLSEQNELVGESSQTWAEFIAGQALLFNVHPRYFDDAARRFANAHIKSDQPKVDYKLA